MTDETTEFYGLDCLDFDLSKGIALLREHMESKFSFMEYAEISVVQPKEGDAIFRILFYTNEDGICEVQGGSFNSIHSLMEGASSVWLEFNKVVQAKRICFQTINS